MDMTRKILFVILVVSIASSVEGQKKYTDENRPYEFGFKIDGEQHRQEKKDENGIIMGEFGYITGDGIYHVTVFATDENGNYKVLSMKHIRVGPSPWGPAKSKTPIVTAAPTPPPTAAVPQKATRAPLSGKPGCSGCLIPTPPPPTRKPPPGVGLPFNNPASSPPSGGKAPVKFPGTPGAPGTGQIPFGTGQKPPGGTFPSAPNGPGAGQVPFGGKYPATGASPGSGQNPPGGKFPHTSGTPGFSQKPPGGKFPGSPALSDPSEFPTRGQFPDSSPGAPGQFPGTSSGSPGQFPGTSSGSPGKFPGTSPGSPGQFPGTFPGAPGQFPGSPGSPGGSRPGSPSGGSPSGPGSQNPLTGQRPGAISAGQRPVDGLPPGLTVDDVTGLLYKFNYSVGFHGHNEQGYRNGDKEGEYNANYRDGLGTIVTYVANENGYQPKVKFVKLSNEETPRAETEKEYGLKGYEFKWFNRR